MSIDVLPTSKQTPQQAILNAETELSDMEQVAVVYIRKGEHHPRLTCSSMTPADMNFMGVALQHYSMKFLLEE